jgi:predicted ATPase
VREGPLPIDDAIRLTREIASALGYAHHAGIVHRDIKPENILLADGIALVADFGIARALRTSRIAGDTEAMARTAVGLALGTPAYMSPEQFTADDVDGRSDLYALGCVAYEMLAGAPPFTGPSLDGLLRQHLTAEPRSLAAVRPAVHVGLAQAVARALAKDPADRYPTAAALAEAIATSGRGAITPAASERAPATPHNLPRPRTRFIGRDRELAECAQLLGEARLLTLTGIGGSGKTRLALRLAERMLATFPDGVWLADVSSLVDPTRVAEAVAISFGLQEAPGRPIIDVLLDHVRGKHLLLVLDNCEHLLEATADLADRMLSAADGVRVVATSREGLGVEGERLFAVRSLSVPAAAKTDLHAVESSDAVQLFVDRARVAGHDFAVTPGNAVALAEICRRLDGIPLALELAAARLKLLSVDQIRDRLDDRFRLLTGGRSAVPRQQTLLATIQWSWEQLPAEEQQLLRRLSVFTGGWTLASATAVAGAPADEFAVLDLLGRLVDKSLVLVEQLHDEARYGMLETVRHYALERMLEAAEGDAVRERHVACFLALARRFDAERFEREEWWTRRLTTEHDNLRAALSFVHHRDAEAYLELVGLLGYFWWARSHIVEGLEHMDLALEQSSPEPARRSYARTLRGKSMLLSLAGEAVQAREAMERGLRMWRQLGDAGEVALSLETIGWAQFLGGEDVPAHATFSELLRLQEGLGDPGMIIRAKAALAQMLVALSRVDEARPLSHEILAFAKKADDKRLEHSGLHYLADCALIEGRCTESLALYHESLVLAEAIGDRVETCAEIEGVAMSLAGLGEHAAAVRLVAASRAELARLGVELRIPFWDALHQRYVAPAREALGAERAGAEMAAGRARTFEEAVAAATVASQAARTAVPGPIVPEGPTVGPALPSMSARRRPSEDA